MPQCYPAAGVALRPVSVRHVSHHGPSEIKASERSENSRLDIRARRQAQPRVLQPSADPAWSLWRALRMAFENPCPPTRNYRRVAYGASLAA